MKIHIWISIVGRGLAKLRPYEVKFRPYDASYSCFYNMSVIATIRCWLKLILY